jgi:type VI secretion system secreted protein VgrG
MSAPQVHCLQQSGFEEPSGDLHAGRRGRALGLSGTSDCRAFALGYTFTLEGFPRNDMNDSYLLIDIQHTPLARGSYGSGENVSGFEYSSRFACISQSIPFRPARVTLRPSVRGSQTAVGVGPKGEEIWVDQYGMVKVQFYSDRKGKENEQSS